MLAKGQCTQGIRRGDYEKREAEMLVASPGIVKARGVEELSVVLCVDCIAVAAVADNLLRFFSYLNIYEPNVMHSKKMRP